MRLAAAAAKWRGCPLPTHIRSYRQQGDTVFTRLGSGYNYDATAIRPCYDHSTLRPVCSGLLRCDLNK